MNRSIITASTTMTQLQQQLNTISNNIANSETAGFKARQSKFSDLLYQQIDNQVEREATKVTPNGIRVGSGARLVATTQNLALGPIKTTDRSLDFALLEGNLLFRIQGNPGEQQEQFTRSGAFYLSPVGADEESPIALVTADGRSVMGQNGPIIFPPTTKSIQVDSLGNIKAMLSDNTEVNVDKLNIVNVLKPQLLEQAGNNTFQLPEGINPQVVMEAFAGTQSVVEQGALEQSNVDIGQEMTELLQVQRSYQLNARAISYANDMMGLVNGIR